MGISLDPSPSSALQFCFMTFLSTICQAVVGCSSGIISRRNFEVVLSKMLDDVNDIVSYKQKYFRCISLPTTNLLILDRENSVYSSCVKNFLIYCCCIIQESPLIIFLCVFFENIFYFGQEGIQVIFSIHAYKIKMFW